MSWTDGGSVGTANSKSSGDTLNITTTASLSAGDFLVVAIAKDNVATTDTNTSEVLSVTAGTETMTKLGERSNGQGSANGGAVASLWIVKMAGSLSSGSTIAILFSSSITAKAAVARKFTAASGAVATADGSLAVTATDGADPGVIASTVNLQNYRNYLVLHVIAGEHSTAAFTPGTTGSDGGQDGTSGGGGASNMSVAFEYAIFNPGGGSQYISNPTWTSGDHIQILIPVFEDARVVTRVAGLNSTGTTLTTGATQAGDYLVVGVVSNEGESCTGSTGWTQRDSVTLSNVTIQLFDYIAGAGETSWTFGFTGTPTTRIAGGRWRKTPQAPAGDIALAGSVTKTSATPTTSHSTNTLTSVPANSALTALFVGRNASPAPWTPASGWDDAFDSNVTPGAPENYGYALPNLQSEDSGAAGNQSTTETSTNSAEQINILWAINVSNAQNVEAQFISAQTAVFSPGISGAAANLARTFAVIVV